MTKRKGSPEDQAAAKRILATRGPNAEEEFKKAVEDVIRKGAALGRHVTVDIKPNTQWDPVLDPDQVQTMVQLQSSLGQLGLEPQRIDGTFRDMNGNPRQFRGEIVDEAGRTSLDHVKAERDALRRRLYEKEDRLKAAEANLAARKPLTKPGRVRIGDQMMEQDKDGHWNPAGYAREA